MLERRSAQSVLALMISVWLGCAPAFALSGFEVVEGDVSLQQEGSIFNITANTDQSIVHFDTFNIGSDQTVNFLLPSSSSSILNRVLGGSASNIMGSLNSNGRVFLVNPAGINTGPSAYINTGGFFASTLNISNSNFMNRNYAFERDPSADLSSINNQGTVHADTVGFLSSQIQNSGTIVADRIVLAAGDQIILNVAEAIQLNVTVHEGLDTELNDTLALISNTGTLEGNEIELAAELEAGLYKGVVNLDGMIVAVSSEGRGGTVRFRGEEVRLVHHGRIDASGTELNPDGGHVYLAADVIETHGEILARGVEGGNGGDIDVISKTETVLASGSVTDASATGTTGDGGDVFIWSDKDSSLEGGSQLFARSGSESGAGGHIELSAVDTVTWIGEMDAAGKDAPGTILIDPTDFVADAAGVDVVNDNAGAAEDTGAGGCATGASGVCNPDASTLDFANNLVIIATQDASVDAPINLTTAGAFVDIRANRNLTVSGTGSITTNNGNIFLTADADNNGVGDLSVLGNLNAGTQQVRLTGFNTSINANITADDLLINLSAANKNDVTFNGGIFNINDAFWVNQLANSPNDVIFNAGTYNSRELRINSGGATSPNDVTFAGGTFTLTNDLFVNQSVNTSANDVTFSGGSFNVGNSLSVNQSAANPNNVNFNGGTYPNVGVNLLVNFGATTPGNVNFRDVNIGADNNAHITSPNITTDTVGTTTLTADADSSGVGTLTLNGPLASAVDRDWNFNGQSVVFSNTVNTGPGDTTVNSVGTFTATQSITGAGISITTTGVASDIVANAGVNLNGGNNGVTLTSNDIVSLVGAGNVTSTGGSAINVLGDNDGNATGIFSVAKSLNSNGGAINMTGSATVGTSVITGVVNAGAGTLTTTANVTDFGAASNVTANNLTVNRSSIFSGTTTIANNTNLGTAGQAHSHTFNTTATINPTTNMTINGTGAHTIQTDLNATNNFSLMEGTVTTGAGGATGITAGTLLTATPLLWGVSGVGNSLTFNAPNINTTGTYDVGTSGTVIVNGPINSAGNLTFRNTFGGTGNVTINGNTNIGANTLNFGQAGQLVNTTLTTGDTATAQDINFLGTGTVTLAGTNTINATNDLSFLNTGGVDINAGVTTALNADSDASGAGTFLANFPLRINGAPVNATITGATVNLNNTFNPAGNGTAHTLNALTGDLNLGAAVNGGSGAFNLLAGQDININVGGISHLGAGDLNLTAGGNILSGLAAAIVNGVANNVTLDSTGGFVGTALPSLIGGALNINLVAGTTLTVEAGGVDGAGTGINVKEVTPGTVPFLLGPGSTTPGSIFYNCILQPNPNTPVPMVDDPLPNPNPILSIENDPNNVDVDDNAGGVPSVSWQYDGEDETSNLFDPSGNPIDENDVPMNTDGLLPGDEE